MPCRCFYQRHAEFTVDRVSRIPGLNVVVPKGAMYMMVRCSLTDHLSPLTVVCNSCGCLAYCVLRRWQFGIDTASYPSIEDDVDFCKKLLAEESVFLLPGQVRAVVLCRH